jgi:hypothetical protein
MPHYHHAVEYGDYDAGSYAYYGMPYIYYYAYDRCEKNDDRDDPCCDHRRRLQ